MMLDKLETLNIVSKNNILSNPRGWSNDIVEGVS